MLLYFVAINFLFLILFSLFFFLSIPYRYLRIFGLVVILINIFLIFKLLFIYLSQGVQTLTYFKLNDINYVFQFEYSYLSLLFLLLNNFIYLLGFPPQLYKNDTKFFSLLFIVYFINNLFFVSKDIITFLVFWELMLVPTAMVVFLYAISDAKKTAFLYVMYNFGFSIFLIFGLLMRLTSMFQSPYYQELSLFFILIGIMVKVPVFPFHGWLYPTYVKIPTLATAIFSSILSKYAVYGFIQLISSFKFDYTSIKIILLTVLFTISYSAFLAIRSQDLKSVFSYMSMSHLNVFIAGLLIFLAQKLNYYPIVIMSLIHGFISFLLFNQLIHFENNIGHLYYRDYGYFLKYFPVLSIFFVSSLLVLAGFPVTAYFISEFYIVSVFFKKSLFFSYMLVLGLILNLYYKCKIFYFTVLKKENINIPSHVSDYSYYQFISSSFLIFLIFFLTIFYKQFISFS